MLLMRTILMSGALIPFICSSGFDQLNELALDDQLAIVDEVAPKPDLPVINTALAFTNPWPVEVKVKLEAYNYEGEEVGEGELVIPPHGLRYFFVSRIGGDDAARFVGWVAARTSRSVAGSAILLGAAGTTDLPVRRFPRRLNTDRVHPRMIWFPLVAAL